MLDLLPVKLRPYMPDLYDQEDDDNPLVFVRFYHRDNPKNIWLLTEFSQDDQDTCFGYIKEGDQGEWGYFSLSYLQIEMLPILSFVDSSGRQVISTETMGCVLRDKSFLPCPLSLAKRQVIAPLLPERVGVCFK